jgi:hypothetical protein
MNSFAATVTVALPKVPKPPALLRLFTITTLLGPEPVPLSVMKGLFDGMLTISR